MRAVVFKDFGKIALEDVPQPDIQEPTDVLLKVSTTAICGSDLHVLHGRMPGMEVGGILGHEFMGTIEKIGNEVSRFKEGDRVLASFTIPCGKCWFCNRHEFNLCSEQRVFGYGSFLGDINGGQAEYVRVPNADLCLRPVNGLSDEQILFAGDIFTTGVDVAQAGQIRQGDIVVVQGCGPVGLMTIQAAKTYAPSKIYAVDTIADRLQMAEKFGAIPVNAAEVHPASFIQDATNGRGADVVLECVGALAAFEQALDTVRAGGRIAVIGVYSEPSFDLPIGIVFVKGIEIKFCGTANIVGHWDHAVQMIESGEAHPDAIISHRMNLSDAEKGYELFSDRTALKVVMTP